MSDPYKDMYNGECKEEQKEIEAIPIEKPYERVKRKVRKAALIVGLPLLIAGLATYAIKQNQVHQKQAALNTANHNYDVVSASFTQTAKELGKTQKELNEKKEKLSQLEKIASAAAKNQNLLMQVNKNYNSSLIYYSEFDVSSLEEMSIRTAALPKDTPVKAEYKDDLKEAYDTYNISFCGSRHIFNEGFKDILGAKWAAYEKDYLDNKIQGFEMKGRKLMVVAKWLRYPDLKNVKGEIPVTKNEQISMKRMIDKYR